MIDDGFLNVGDHDSFANGVPHKTFERLRREDPVCPGPNPPTACADSGR